MTLLCRTVRNNVERPGRTGLDERAGTDLVEPDWLKGSEIDDYDEGFEK